MKKLITLVAILVMFVGTVSANGIIPPSSGGGGVGAACVPPEPPGPDIDIDNKNINTNKNANTNLNCNDNTAISRSKSNSSLIQDIDYEEKLQGVSTGFPGHLWMVPRDKFYWNQLGFDPALLESINWTEETAKNIVDSPKICFVRNKMKVVVHNLFGKRCEESESLKLSLTPPSEGYVFSGSVNVSAKVNQKGLTSLICIAWAVKNALEQGADLVVLVDGMTPVNQGSSFGLGTTLISSSGNNAATGAGGIGLADTRQRGEPAAILTMYKSQAAMAAAVVDVQEQVSEVIEVEKPEKPSPLAGLFKAVGNLFAKKSDK